MRLYKTFILLLAVCYSFFSYALAETSEALWAKSLAGGLENSHFHSTATDTLGNVYAAGYIIGNNTYDFGNSVTVSGSTTGKSIVLVKYNSSGEAQWAKSMESGGSDSEFLSIAIDGCANIYAVGYIFYNTHFNFGGGVTINGSSFVGANVVIVKYNSDGEPQWAKTQNGSLLESLYAHVATDLCGNVYAVGSLDGGTSIYNFGNDVSITTTFHGENPVLVKYNSSGETQWAKSVVNATDRSLFLSVALDSYDDVYVAGLIEDSNPYDFEDGVIISGGVGNKSNPVLVKYNSNGETQWAKSVISGSNSSQFESIAVDNNDNIYVAGYIIGTDIYDFGNSVTISGAYTNKNVLLLKYNTIGESQWAKSTISGSSANDSHFCSVAIDGKNNIYAAGYIMGTDTYDFGNNVKTHGAYSGKNILLIKYNSIGESQWGTSLISGAAESEFSSVVIDNYTDIYIFAAGYIVGSDFFNFGNDVTISAPYSGSNINIVKYANQPDPIPTPTPTPTPTPDITDAAVISQATKWYTLLGLGAAFLMAI